MQDPFRKVYHTLIDDCAHVNTPSPKLRRLPLPSDRIRSMKQHATNIVRELRERGFQAYFAGGCVRDTLLAVVPADYDVATDARPADVMRIFPETYAVGAQFGVVLVPLKTPTQAREAWVGHPAPPATVPSEHPNYVEVATFRKDGTYTDGRHPDRVSYAT